VLRTPAEGAHPALTMRMRLGVVIPCTYVERLNRFRVTVTIRGRQVDAHLPNSGRLMELLTPGRRCWVAPVSGRRRKTAYDLKLVEHGDVLVSVDARLPNPLLAEALEEGRLGPFRACQQFDREVVRGGSRVDFLLRMPEGRLWMEAKSVTLVENDTARFPDAPTTRGARHVQELSEAVSSGDQAAVVFVVQRADARRFAPHDEADPAFGQALRQAAEAGVGVYAWTCRVTKERMAIAERIRVDLS